MLSSEGWHNPEEYGGVREKRGQYKVQRSSEFFQLNCRLQNMIRVATLEQAPVLIV